MAMHDSQSPSDVSGQQRPPLIVTLDGPAGSGKSSVARMLAKRLEVDFLDTGAMYRGLAAWCLDHDIPLQGEDDQIIEALSRMRMTFDWQADPPLLHVNDKPYGHRLREADVTQGVSHVAALGPVRKRMVAWQQAMGKAHPRLVTEGRDQGTVVFPEAQVKFYLVASPMVRARRRTSELSQAGHAVDLQEVMRDIIDRDARDMARADGPLRKPDDALEVDTSDMTFDEVVDDLYSKVLDRCSSDAQAGE